MRKREFLKTLERELSHLDRDEREDILEYYNELIEDTIEKTGKSEGDVVYDLGDIEDIVRRIDPAHRRKIHYDEVEETRPSSRREVSRKNEKNTSSKMILGILLLIFLFPLWIVIFALLFSLMITIISIGISFIACAVLLIWNGFTLCTTSIWAQGIFRIGIGLLFMGVTIIVIPLLSRIVTGIGKLIVVFFKWLFCGRRRR